jgi:hypothetical protein
MEDEDPEMGAMSQTAAFNNLGFSSEVAETFTDGEKDIEYLEYES